jgi:hypothetical protein
MMNRRFNLSERDLYDAALQEYRELEAGIRQFTANSMQTKNWSVAVGLAGILIAFIQKQPAVFLLSPITAILFWVMDARWRAYLFCFIERQKEIESFFLGEVHQYVGPQINRSFDRSFDRMKNELSAWNFARNSSIHIPHSIVAFVAISAYALTTFGVIAFPQ